MTPQLQMIFPPARFSPPPVVRLPETYTLRVYRRGDEPAFYRLMERAGFGVWNDDTLRSWLTRILPDSWFFVEHRAPAEAPMLTATAMALHDASEQHPFGGELGWVAADPDHRQRGLGSAVSAAVTARLVAMGYRNIHLYTEDWRLPALRTYLRLGYVPFLYASDTYARWQAVCLQLRWQFTPKAWQAAYPVP